MKCSSLVVVAVSLVIVGLVGAALTGCGNSVAQADRSGVADSGGPSLTTSALTNPSAAETSGGSGKGMAAMKQAAEAGKYLFIFFSKEDDEQTLAMRKVFDSTMEKLTDRAQSVAVRVTDSSERDIVNKFDLRRAPMPLVLAVAPNGAITGGFATKFEERQLLDAFATPATEKVMKALQDGKLVFVCVQNGKTKSNDEAMQGVRDFKSDPRFARATEIVTLDPSDKSESTFLTDLNVSPEITEATTVFVLPPGQAIARIEGPTDKDALVALLSRASAGCGAGGCGAGGCGPGGCGPKR